MQGLELRISVPNGEAVSILAMPPQAASNAVSDAFGFFARLIAPDRGEKPR